MPRAFFKRDPPEEPPSEERYAVEGRSPGLRVIAMAPAFPSLVQKLSDTKWSHHSPLTVAGAAPDSAQRAPPASRLSPAVMPEAGNLDRLLQQHREAAVKRHIKISLYASAEGSLERSISGWKRSAFQFERPRPQPRGGGDLLVRPRPFGRLPASEPALRDRQERARSPKPSRWGWRSERSAI